MASIDESGLSYTTEHDQMFSIKEADPSLSSPDPSQETHICVSTVGSYESALIWRTKYIDWLDRTPLFGTFRVALITKSRTWILDICFSDIRDAVMFKVSS